MNFDPTTRAWLLLLCLTFGTAGSIGYTAYLSGSSVVGACIVGLSSACLQIYNRLSDAPKDMAMKAKTNAPFEPIAPAPKVP